MSNEQNEKQEEQEDEWVKLVDIKKLAPKKQLKVYLTLGIIGIALLIIVAAALGAYVAKYQAYKYFVDLIENQCTCYNIPTFR